jgi:DNA-binding NtrC family response regulator
MVAVEKRILVVDDEEIVRESCRRVLTEAGYAVRTVANGREALNLCRAEQFDVMLTDLRMADMDGLEVIRAAAREFPGMRVVVITGYPSRESLQQAQELGVCEYVEKPLNPSRLNEVTATALSSKMTLKAPAPAPALAAEAPARPSVEFVPAPQAAHPAYAAAGRTTRLLVTGAIGFLLGVAAAYVVAPNHGLAYLLVGSAIVSGTLLGLFSDALFGKSAKNPGASGAKP